MSGKDNWAERKRLAGLRRFATAITTLNVVGHLWLGFEQSWIQPFVALGAAYGTELLLEWVESWSRGRRPRFLGHGPVAFVDFLLSAHISALAVSMLTYANERLGAVAFAAVISIVSKHVFRAPAAGGGTRHFLNPSNFGITMTLLCFSWVGMMPPYMFTENLMGRGDVILPLIVICLGSLLNTLFTGRVLLIAAWLVGFALQAAVRGVLFDAPFVAGFVPMTGVAFLLFSFYMVTDPATTPSEPRQQIAFGLAVALVYGLLASNHVVYTMFFALTIVTIVRGLLMHAEAWALARRPAAAEVMPAA
jgi:hypothetical protein